MVAQLLIPRRFGFKTFRLSFMVSKELLADDNYFTAALRRIRMQNLPLHLQDLDAGDLAFMKQVGMDELEYRSWLFEEVEDKAPLKLGAQAVPASQEELRQAAAHGLDGAVTGRHYDQIIVDDIGETPRPSGGFLGRASFREIGKHPGLAAAYPSSPPPNQMQSLAPPTMSSVIQHRRNTVMAFKDELEHRFQILMKSWDIADQTPPTDASYHGALSEVFSDTLAYLEAAQGLLNQTSINMSLPDIGNAPQMAQGVDRG